MTNKNPALAAVNFHLFKPCNYRCRFCFATFRDIKGRLGDADAFELLAELRAAGADKLNFAGGEPTLHPQIGPLVRRARELGFTTSIITNGEKLGALLDDHAADLDWVGLSVDSGIESVQRDLGRGKGGHVARSIELSQRLHSLSIAVKLNTVVTSLNWDEDMHDLVRQLRPRRWKVFQVLPIKGQNDGSVEPLLIDSEKFEHFVERHRDLDPVAESNEAMTASYVMIDPLGRFFDNQDGRLQYSPPILEVGVELALSQIRFDRSRFVERGGLYQWRR